MRPTLGVFLLLGAALCAQPVLATTAADLCPGGSGPCIIRGTVRVDPGSTIDVGDRHLVISTGGTLMVGPGEMTLLAGRLTVEQGGALRAPGSASEEAGIISATAGVITIAGRIDAAGAPGGSVTLNSDAELIINGSIDASSRHREEDGGIVIVSGGTVQVTAPITVTGGREGFGGEIDISAMTDVTVSRTLEANGGEGGSVTVEAGIGGAGNLTIDAAGRIQADAQGDGGFGDMVDLSASGDGTLTGLVVMNGLISVSGTAAGSGGSIIITADGTIAANDRSSRMTATGGRPTGDGGDIDLTTLGGGLTSIAQIDVSGATEGRGGDVSMDITGPVTLGGTIEASSGTAGGRIDITAEGELMIDGNIRSNGETQAGGRIRVQGCNVTLNSRATLSSEGASGSNRLVGRDQTVVRGNIRADQDTGLNEIVYGSERRRPIIFGSASVEPPAAETLDSTLIPCVPEDTPVPSNTPTRTPTRTITPTPTPTSGCIGDCNQRGSVSINELVVGVNIALERSGIEACPPFDANHSGGVEINELVAAVNNALSGCPQR